MRFMMMVKGDKNYEAGNPPDPKLLAAMGQLSENMAKAGGPCGQPTRPIRPP